jgi:hypothetical protein
MVLIALITVLFCIGCNKKEEHEHTYEYIQYETSHFKFYTCGCPSPEIAGAHYDDDNDNYCDLCLYKMNIQTQEKS